MYVCTHICCTVNEKEAMNLKESRDGRIWREERVRGNGVIIISKIKRSNFFKRQVCLGSVLEISLLFWACGKTAPLREGMWQRKAFPQSRSKREEEPDSHSPSGSSLPAPPPDVSTSSQWRFSLWASGSHSQYKLPHSQEKIILAASRFCGLCGTTKSTQVYVLQ